MEATRQIHHEQPGVKIIVLSLHPVKQYVRETFKAGASGCLLEDCDYQELLTAVGTVARSGTYASSGVDYNPQDNRLHET